MPEQFVNKVVFGGETLIDLTSDTVDKEHVLSGYVFHTKEGATETGACTYDSDTSADTAAVAEILSGKTAHARGTQLTGTMPNIGKQNGTISSKDGSVTISKGYHDGSGKISLASVEKEKLQPQNIREGVTILGVVGSMSSTEGERIQSNVYVTPSMNEQIILPADDYTCLAQVTVEPIPYSRADNSAGGVTVTIGEGYPV